MSRITVLAIVLALIQFTSFADEQLSSTEVSAQAIEVDEPIVISTPRQALNFRDMTIRPSKKFVGEAVMILKASAGRLGWTTLRDIEIVGREGIECDGIIVDHCNDTNIETVFVHHLRGCGISVRSCNNCRLHHVSVVACGDLQKQRPGIEFTGTDRRTLNGNSGEEGNFVLFNSSISEQNEYYQVIANAQVNLFMSGGTKLHGMWPTSSKCLGLLKLTDCRRVSLTSVFYTRSEKKLLQDNCIDVRNIDPIDGPSGEK